MKVLQVHWTFPPTTGGVESHLADLSAALAKRDCEVTVLTGEAAPEAPPGVRVLSSPLLDLEQVRVGRWDDSAHTAALLSELGRLIEDMQPEVVHAHNVHHFSPGPAIALDTLSQRYGFKLHHTFHETWPDVLHEQPVYRHWAGNYAVSAHVRNECEARIGFRPESRPLGIDVDRFRTTRSVLADTSVPTILHPARLLPWKGVHTSVAMLAELRRRGIDVRLVVTDTARIADWHHQLHAYRQHVLELVDQLNVADRFILRPAAYGEMPALYEEADVVIYPTVADEPYGLVPLEAMSAQRPVIASRCGGIVETVVDGVTGFLITPDNALELADRVAFVLADPERARAMGSAGRRHVASTFRLDAYVDRMLDSYRSVSVAQVENSA